MSKVYTCMEWTDYGGGQVRRVFAVKEKAFDFIKTQGFKDPKEESMKQRTDTLGIEPEISPTIFMDSINGQYWSIDEHEVE